MEAINYYDANEEEAILGEVINMPKDSIGVRDGINEEDKEDTNENYLGWMGDVNGITSKLIELESIREKLEATLSNSKTESDELLIKIAENQEEQANLENQIKECENKYENLKSQLKQLRELGDNM